jgi:hypothetical protein
MKQFRDSKNIVWTVEINVSSIKRVKGALDCDLLKVVEGNLIEELISNPVLLCDVLFVICKAEADKLGISDSDFGSAMSGDSLENATTALLEELVDFFPKAKRQLLTKALGKFQQMEVKAMQRANDKLESKEFQDKLDKLLENVGA